jgi:hypothetical protein
MAKKAEPKVVEVKTIVLSSGETATVKVYEAEVTPKGPCCKFKHAKQTSDFNLIGNWKRNSTAQD